MINLILNAIPFFLLSIVIEFFVLRRAAADDHGDPAEAPVGYELKDTRTSLTMGIGHAVIYSGWKLVMLAAYAGLYLLSPLRLDPSQPWVWVLLFFADDLSYYAYHRAHHRIRLFWATHVVHHSSQHYNLSTALRQDWMPISSIFFWAPLALLGFQPWMILLAISWNLLYQFWIHTEKIRRLPGWYEAVFNTPSHHRVHHGANEQYLDKNYGGILIIWDKLFGTYEPEQERVRYGLTTNIETYNPFRVAFHEFVAIWRDVRGASTWRDRLGYMLKGPGWQPAVHDLPSSSIQRSGESGREAEHFPGVKSLREHRSARTEPAAPLPSPRTAARASR